MVAGFFATRLDGGVVRVVALLPRLLFRAIGLFLTEHRTLVAVHPIIVVAGGQLAAIGIEPRPYKASKIAS